MQPGRVVINKLVNDTLSKVRPVHIQQIFCKVLKNVFTMLKNNLGLDDYSS